MIYDFKGLVKEALKTMDFEKTGTTDLVKSFVEYTKFNPNARSRDYPNLRYDKKTKEVVLRITYADIMYHKYDEFKNVDILLPKIFRFMENLGGYFLANYSVIDDLENYTFSDVKGSKNALNDIINVLKETVVKLKQKNKSVNFHNVFDDPDRATLIKLNFQAKNSRIIDPKNLGDVAYHVTNQKYIDKIKKMGLSPKNQSKRNFHPERIYLMQNKERALNLINQLNNDKNISNYLLTINISQFKKNNSFYIDPDLFGQSLLDNRYDVSPDEIDKEAGLYITKNIPPQLIQIEKI